MATVAWSGFYGDLQGTSGGYGILVNKNPRRNGIRRTMNRQGFREVTALFNGLVGAATGSNVTATHSQLAAAETGIGASGGVRTIETITDINRDTVAGDVTALKELTYNVTTRPATYPADASGNGGTTF